MSYKAPRSVIARSLLLLVLVVSPRVVESSFGGLVRGAGHGRTAPRPAFVRDAGRRHYAATRALLDSSRPPARTLLDRGLPSPRSLQLFASSQRHSASDDADDSGDSDEECRLSPVPPKWDGVPIPFVEVAGVASSSSSAQSLGFIECFADSLAHCLGKEYVIGVPCDYSVALCYYNTDDENDPDRELVPLELDDPELDDVFPVAEAIVSDEFGEELVLQRTPQTLTLVGELEEDEEEDEFEDEDEDDEDDEEAEEEVEVLLKFEHRDKEYNLVRFMDPILLVGRQDPDNAERCLLLTTEESDQVMPLLEGLFLDFHMQDNPDGILP